MSSSIADAADAIAYLFNEELGAVIQVPAARARARRAAARRATRSAHHVVARIAQHDDIVVRRAGTELYRAPRVELRRKWSELTFRMQALRDDPQCAREAFDDGARSEGSGSEREAHVPAADASAARPRAPGGRKSPCSASRA